MPRACPTAAMPSALATIATWLCPLPSSTIEAAQPLAVVVEQLGRPHGARHEDRVGRQLRRLVGAGYTPGEDAQQAVREIVEVALALAPVGIVLAQHARARAVLHALDRGLGGQAALDRLAQPPLPALVVGEHAVGFEHVAVLAGARRGARGRTSRRAKRCSVAIAVSRRTSSSAGSSAISVRDDDARLVQHDVARARCPRTSARPGSPPTATLSSSTAVPAPATAPETRCSATTIAVACSTSTSSSEYSFCVRFCTTSTPSTCPLRWIGTASSE